MNTYGKVKGIQGERQAMDFIEWLILYWYNMHIEIIKLRFSDWLNNNLKVRKYYEK